MIKISENLDLNDLDGEFWKDILDYEGNYQVSNLGRVKSFKKYLGTNERILKQNKNSSGYFHINLSKNGKQKKESIHRLMYESFIGEIPEEYDVHHIDEK
jgi:hypothetical protein